MIKNILAVGDSFTYGQELKTSRDAYPQLIADRIGATLINQAAPGSGNKRMVRKIIDHITLKNPVDLVIIGWTSPGRMEFCDAAGIFDIWPGYSGRLFAQDQPWRMELLEYINKHHDPEYIYRMYLLDIIMLQNFLCKHNIKYIMLTTCSNEYYHNIYYSKSELLTDLIDSKYYVGWPTEGMAEWTRGCKRGPEGHFLAEGHKRVADKLYEYIRDFGWLS